MANFLEALHSSRVILMDGAMGTELQRAGLKEGECPELWNLTHPDRVRAIHQSYVYAGAQCLVTNTFQSNPKALAKYGLENRLEEINQAAIDIARSVRGVRRFVFASIGPTDREDFDRVANSLRRADAILLETWSEFDPVTVNRAFDPSNPLEIPMLLSFTYSRSSIKDAVRTSCHFASEIAALGVNCGRDIGMDEIIHIVKAYRQVTDLPLLARPNAGTPQRINNQWHYSETPQKMATRLPELIEAGATLIGGCCGTTPAHIAAFREVIDRLGVGWRG